MTATSNIGIYHPRVFHVRSGPNQSDSTKCDWGSLSPSSVGRLGKEKSKSK